MATPRRSAIGVSRKLVIGFRFVGSGVGTMSGSPSFRSNIWAGLNPIAGILPAAKVPSPEFVGRHEDPGLGRRVRQPHEGHRKQVLDVDVPRQERPDVVRKVRTTGDVF